MKKEFDISDFVGVRSITGTMKDIAKREKALRKKLGYTQKRLCKITGVSLGSLRRFESTGQISLLRLLDIANALGCLEDFNLLFLEGIPEDLSKL